VTIDSVIKFLRPQVKGHDFYYRSRNNHIIALIFIDNPISHNFTYLHQIQALNSIVFLTFIYQIYSTSFFYVTTVEPSEKDRFTLGRFKK